MKRLSSQTRRMDAANLQQGLPPHSSREPHQPTKLELIEAARAKHARASRPVWIGTRASMNACGFTDAELLRMMDAGTWIQPQNLPAQ